MSQLETVFLLSTLVTIVAGLILVGMGIRAYSDTRRQQMMHLAAGFGLIVIASIGTATWGLATDFSSPRQLLAINSGVSSSGYILILYSLMTY